MLLLAFDTSTRQSSIALCTEDALLGEYTWYAGTNHSVELLENMQRLLADSQSTLAQVDALVVAAGPGSFNGVRVAVSTAKALAFSLQKPLLAIPTLDSVAAQQSTWQGPICAVLEAGRGELYAACYRSLEDLTPEGEAQRRLERVGDYQVLEPSALVAHLRVILPGEAEAATERLPWLFCGELKQPSRVALQALLGSQGRFATAHESARRASMLAMLGLQRLRMGQSDDPFTLEPLYLRRPSITRSTRKQPLLAGVTPPESKATQAG